MTSIFQPNMMLLLKSIDCFDDLLQGGSDGCFIGNALRLDRRANSEIKS